jgi:hypothetical protein
MAEHFTIPNGWQEKLSAAHCDIAGLIHCALDTGVSFVEVALIIVHVHHYNASRLQASRMF